MPPQSTKTFGVIVRPLKIVLDTEKNKIQVIRRAKNLRDEKDGGPEKVFVHQDLTPRQREDRRKLVQTLNTRLAQGEKDLVIYRGEIVKRRRSQHVVTISSVCIVMLVVLSGSLIILKPG